MIKKFESFSNDKILIIKDIFENYMPDDVVGRNMNRFDYEMDFKPTIISEWIENRIRRFGDSPISKEEYRSYSFYEANIIFYNPHYYGIVTPKSKFNIEHNTAQEVELSHNLEDIVNRLLVDGIFYLGGKIRTSPLRHHSPWDSVWTLVFFSKN